VRVLAERTAELHLVLASDTEDEAFKPEPFTPHYMRGLYQSMRNLTRQNFHALNRQFKNLSAEDAVLAQKVLSQEQEILHRFRAIYEKRYNAMRIRHHGDFHLGQVLNTGNDFLIIDFEGEPLRSIGERRLKACPLRDVAGMIRSLHYASQAALAKYIEQGLSNRQREGMAEWGRFWSRWISAIYYRSYRESMREATFLPSSDADFKMLTDVFLLRKAVYEVGYELASRPAWLKIPLQGILELLNGENT